MIIWLALQAAAPPDIELRAIVDARSVTIEKRGSASLAVTATPDGGSLVKVEAPKANGARTLRNVRVKIGAEARISPEQTAGATPRAQRR